MSKSAKSAKIISYIDKVLASIEIPVVFITELGIISVLLYGAINRYFIHGTFPQEAELAWIFHIWLIFIGGSLVLRGGDHPFVGIIRDKRGKLYKTIMMLLCIIFSAIMLYYTIDYYGVYGIQKTTFLRLPKTILYIAMILGFTFMIIRYTIKIILLYKPSEVSK